MADYSNGVVGFQQQEVVENQRLAVKGNDTVLQATDKYIKDMMPLLDLAGGDIKAAVLGKANGIKQTWYAQVADSAAANIAFGKNAENIANQDVSGAGAIRGSVG